MTLSAVTTIAPSDSLVVFEELLTSLKFVDNCTIYAMDMRGNQDLSKLAKKYSCQIIHVPTPPVVEHIRAQQVRDADSDWVLVMDFDEVVTPELREEIVKITRDTDSVSTYSIPRQNFSLGYPLKYGGWGTDYVIRLFKRADFIDWPTDIHSTPTFRGELATLDSHMEHHKDQSLDYIVSKTNRYSDKEASQYYEGGMAPVTSFTLLRKLKMEMIRRGIFRKGLLDGKIGLIQSIYQGFSVFISYAKLFELQQKSKNPSHSKNN